MAILGILARILSGQAETCTRIECLPPHLRRIAEKYRNAIAEVLGLPPEAIREDVVVRWVTHWMHAFVKPEYWHMLRSLIYTWEPTVVSEKVDSRERIWVLY